MEEALIKESIWQKTSTKIVLVIIAGLAVFGGIAFLNTDNNNSPQVMSAQTLENGLVIEDTKIGDGQEIKNGDTVVMNYTGYLEDGTVFDSSLDEGRTPFSFTVGSGMVIQGWEQGVPGMKVGGERKLTIPSDLAYGDNGIPGAIPGGATLIFDIQAVDIQ